MANRNKELEFKILEGFYYKTLDINILERSSIKSPNQKTFSEKKVFWYLLSSINNFQINYLRIYLPFCFVHCSSIWDHSIPYRNRKNRNIYLAWDNWYYKFIAINNVIITFCSKTLENIFTVVLLLYFYTNVICKCKYF